MVIPHDPSAAVKGRQSTSPTISDFQYPDGDECVPDSQDEATPELETKAPVKGSPGQSASSNRYRNEGDRGTAQRLPRQGAPASTVPPPRMHKGYEPPVANAAPEANRHTGDYYQSTRNDARREGHEQYTGEKRPHQSSEPRRDSRDEKGHSYERSGGETDAQRRHRNPEESHRSRDLHEDKGREDTEKRGGGGEHRQPGSSTTRSYSAAVGNQANPNHGPQRENKPSRNEALQGGPPQGPPAQHRHSTPYPHPRSDGHSNQNHRSGDIGRRDHRGPDSNAAVQTSSFSPPSRPNAYETPESEQQQQAQHDGSSGKGRFGQFLGSLLSGGGPSAPSECKCKEHEVTIVKMEETLLQQQQDMRRVMHHRDQLGHRLQHADREVANLNEKLRYLTNELHNVHKELVDAKALSDTRGKELIGAQTFLTKADTISVSEIVGLARTVNNEILQMAASLCDEFSPEVYMDTEEDAQHHRAHLENAIGPELTKLMVDIPDKSTVNPLVAQIILQALLCSHLGKGIDKWHDGKGSTERTIVDLYDNIRQTENQAVSGRWRALTRARLRPQLEKWVDNFFKELQRAMQLAGWTLTNLELRQTLPEKMQPVFRAAEKLRRAMGEQFTSADIEIATVEWYTPFSAHEMEDDWGDSRNSSSSVQEIVGGTTGLGLKRRVAHDGSDEIISYETILPPKVVFMSSLREIAEPPPPRPRRKKVSGGDGPGASG
ncbi:hypothetical protein D9619_002185 [Psilocybe cf. subviscida]|uniref:Uncharacterized protein n=1 Tax=Psilocybe cf. subviscida TaxID=2480587 RepID=A0A8H5F2Z8_9AGAR|nr:hypothetical protein D9619_002185 [Psilocybe cf. subviscida]